MADETHEEIHVDADPTRCFELASRFEDYPEWAGDVKAATVLARDDAGRGTRVEYRASALGRTIRYVLDYDFAQAPAAFSWTLVEGDMLRALDGRYTFEPDARGTQVGYDLRVDLSVPMPGVVKRRASGLIVSAAMRDLKRTAEVPTTNAPMSTSESRSPVTQPPGPQPPVDSTPPEDTTHPDAVDFDAAGRDQRTLPAPSVLESVITELLGAVPEVRDHVLEAADALLDAAKALIDAADRVVRQ
ncbi:MAG: SRPBCC family protein, partial [Acidimicrobiia bacterium]